jgi:hypothetical protein
MEALQMRRLRLGAMLLSALLMASARADAREEEVRRHVDEYLRDFNEVRSPQHLAETYLSAPITIVSSEGVRHLASIEDVASWLRQMQKTLRESGWIRSEFLATRICMTADDVAVFSMKLARIGEAGPAVLGATYTLFRSDRWRIVAIMIGNPDRLLGCDPTG